MIPDSGESHERSNRVDQAIAEYLEAVEQGAPPVREEFLARHADLADELQAFFVNQATFIRRADGVEPVRPASDAAPVSVPAGEKLGDFEIICELGRGGMGVVYEARQISLKRRVALKVLRSGWGADVRAVLRFRREAEAAARLHHTNIVPIYATGQEGEIHFYAMELIEGPSLDCVLRELRRAPPAEFAGSQYARDDATESRARRHDATEEFAGGDPANDGTARTPAELRASGVGASSTLQSARKYFDDIARMIADVADALAHAHNQGVIHRDIKPSNLLLSPDGRLSVNDFGLARMMEQPRMTMTGEFLGSPAYMSPEQITAGRIPIDHRTDIYSLGATLFELLTLRAPFIGERRDQVLSQILHKDPTAPRRINRKVPVDLETICLKAMDKDPDRRYQTADQMARDLRNFVNRFAISARRTGPVGKAIKWVRRHRALSTMLATVVLVTTLASFFAYNAWLSRRELHATQLQDALDDALVSALSGDLGMSEEAIARAESLGAEAGWISMLRGHVAYHRGRYDESITLLRRAADQLPESVAGHSLLASAYVGAGWWEKYEERLAVIERLRAKTPEDYLFRGLAESYLDPVRGLRSIDEAIRRRKSPVAYVIRSEVWANQAVDSASPREIEEALDDAHMALEMLPDSPTALVGSLYAHMIAAGIYGETAQPALREEMREAADRDAKLLGKHTHLPAVAYLRALHAVVGGNVAESHDILQNVGENTDNSLLAYAGALSLYRQGEYQQALDALERRPQRSSNEDLLRALCLLERFGPESRFEQAYREMKRVHSDGLAALFRPGLMLLCGRRDDAVADSREIGLRASQLPRLRHRFYERLLEFNGDRLALDELLKAAGRSKWDQCEARFFAGLHQLSLGRRDQARTHFQHAVDTRCWGFMAWDWSFSFLLQMDRDAAWPRWIAAPADETMCRSQPHTGTPPSGSPAVAASTTFSSAATAAAASRSAGSPAAGWHRRHGACFVKNGADASTCVFVRAISNSQARVRLSYDDRGGAVDSAVVPRSAENSSQVLDRAGNSSSASTRIVTSAQSIARPSRSTSPTSNWMTASSVRGCSSTAVARSCHVAARRASG